MNNKIDVNKMNRLIVWGYEMMENFDPSLLDIFLENHSIYNKHVIITDLNYTVGNHPNNFKAKILLNELSSDGNDDINLYYFDDANYKAKPVDLDGLNIIYDLFYK